MHFIHYILFIYLFIYFIHYIYPIYLYGLDQMKFQTLPFNNVLWFFMLNKHSRKGILCSEVDSAFPTICLQEISGTHICGECHHCLGCQHQGNCWYIWKLCYSIVTSATQGSLSLHCTGLQSSSGVTERPKGCSLHAVFGTLIIQWHTIPFHVNSKVWLYLDNLKVSVKMTAN